MGSSAKDAWTSHFYFSSLGVVNVVELTMFLELKNPGKSTFSEDKKERVMGIEPTYPAWKAGVLPLNYTRMYGLLCELSRGDRIRTCDLLLPKQAL